MNGRCCADERTSRPLARGRTGVAAALLPGAALILLPKCPLCLAAWLTVVTGISVSAAAVSSLRWLAVAFCAATLAVAGAQVIRRLRVRRFSGVR